MEIVFENLIQLQKIDVEINEASNFLNNIPSQLEEIDNKIEESFKIVSQAKDELAANQKKRRELEAEVQDTKPLVTKYKRQLGEVKTNKEYTSLLHEIDETDNFSNIGGNTVFAISVANAEAAATSYGLPLFQYLSGYRGNELPYPLGNVLGGGKHALGKTTDIQEYLVIPLKARSFAKAAKANIMVHQKIGALLRKADQNFTGGRGDEGAWAPNIENEDALNRIAGEVKELCDSFPAPGL